LAITRILPESAVRTIFALPAEKQVFGHGCLLFCAIQKTIIARRQGNTAQARTGTK